MELGAWEHIQSYEMDLDIPLYLNNEISSVESRMRDAAIIEEKIRLNGTKGKIFTQRAVGAFFNVSTTEKMQDKVAFIRRIKRYFKQSYVDHEEIQKIEHTSKNSGGYYVIVNTTKLLRRCFFSQVGYRLGEETSYSNEEGQFDTILTMHYCDPLASVDKFKETLTKVDISGGEKELRATLAAKGNRAISVGEGGTTRREASELGAAVITGDTAKVQALLSIGADPNAEVSFTRSNFNRGKELHTRVLLAAVVYRHPKIVDLLIQHNVSLKMYWNAFVICAAVNTGQDQIVSALIKAGIEVNPNFSCIRGLSPLESAKRRGYLDIVKLLTDAGAV